MRLSRRQSAVVGLAGLATLLGTRRVCAADTDYGLVEPGTCLAGNWGEPRRQWRLQLAVFTSDDAERRARDHQAVLRKRRVAAEVYIAMWLVEGDEWDRLAVVSAQVFAGPAGARRAARALRERGIPAFARHFTRYVR